MLVCLSAEKFAEVFAVQNFVAQISVVKIEMQNYLLEAKACRTTYFACVYAKSSLAFASCETEICRLFLSYFKVLFFAFKVYRDTISLYRICKVVSLQENHIENLI